MSIVVEGLTETIDYMYAIEMKLNAIKTKWLDRFCEKISNEAKRNCPVDTGALQESIYRQITKATTEEIIEEVRAGSETVIRGEGRFTQSKYGKLTPTATAEYAWKVEEKSQFMEQAYQWALANVDNEMELIMKEVLK